MRKQAQRGEPDGKSQQEADADLNLNPSASPAAGPTRELGVLWGLLGVVSGPQAGLPCIGTHFSCSQVLLFPATLNPAWNGMQEEGARGWKRQVPVLTWPLTQKTQNLSTPCFPNL